MQDTTTLAQLLKTSHLGDVLLAMLEKVKKFPQDTGARETLFKMYCADGQWSKALTQLQTLGVIDNERSKQIELFKNLVFSEMLRVQVLSGERKAGMLHEGDAPEWMSKLHKANLASHKGNTDESEALREEAFDLAPMSGGTGETSGQFEWIADSDGRLGPICEFISAGGYRWVPYADIQSMEISQPKDLLDLIWAPAHIKVNDQVYYGFIPSRYPVSEAAEQEIKLGYKTEWNQLSPLLSVGSGRKVLITDQNEYSLFETGNITFG
ncbi:type VI secretion system accessory protein TagJ [Enterobacillus tribolii]|uniref:Type VI secretion system protein ImpE n=1 Tax=Enterobacillus tribolii TaxID=1487935 RepID=A0A370Q5I2_9GAMM|nr:type VI secretion system accessory protein TagJ [Enterobacillus tribolii]MBW7985082.1 ImpE family T6SS protein Cts1E [Enterobacillus tribolii]RDK83310.1 type VI secretion system protein ImpE [Enterobacillus tribolii]